MKFQCDTISNMITIQATGTISLEANNLVLRFKVGPALLPWLHEDKVIVVPTTDVISVELLEDKTLFYSGKIIRFVFRNPVDLPSTDLKFPDSSLGALHQLIEFKS